jgi:hypothetical protein
MYSTIFGGHEVTCGIATGTECWGRLTGTPLDTPTATTPAFAQLSTIGGFACGMTASGDRYCWGDNARGQLGTGAIGGMTTVPPATAQETGLSAIEVGDNFACELKSGGVYCWGDDGNGQLAPQPFSSDPIPSPSQVGINGSPLTSCQQLAVTQRFACALCGGQVYCWGSDGNHGLGRDPDSSPPDANVPAPPALPSGKQWTMIAAGSWHGCALDSSGELYCWGSGVLGQLGDGSTDILFPTPLPALP